MNRTVYCVYKKQGETPLQALTRLRRRKRLNKESLTYAGRLDPMASGLLLVLAGKAIQHKDVYLNLPKVYNACVLLGFSSDSGDILGLARPGKTKTFSIPEIKATLASMVGELNLPLPRYASVPVEGKPLWMLARSGKLKHTPLRKSVVYKISQIITSQISSAELLKQIPGRVKKVAGDFRQEKILKHWQRVLKKKGNKFQLVFFTVRCASGTYVRSLAEGLGRRLGVKALLYNLERTRIGNYGLSKCE